MQLQTASQVINFAVELEDKSAKFYEELAEKFKQHKEFFLSFVKENKKNKLLVQRVYNEVVSDALETGFSFEDLGIDDYLIEINLAEDVSLPDVLKKALDIEAKIERFYLNAAKKSKSFLADVPRVFEKIGKKRDERKEKLKSLW
jgi:rubrerythrin